MAVDSLFIHTNTAIFLILYILNFFLMHTASTSPLSTFASRATAFYFNQQLPALPGSEIEIIDPYKHAEVRDVVNQFYEKFFSDNQQRVFILGINPGRFGGGVTGISFTDPIALREHCGIPNSLGSRTELSSKFVYMFINQFGGPQAFYSRFFLSALYPLAIVKGGKNYNFYDEPALYKALQPAIIASIQQQIAFGAHETAICLGKKNADYLSRLNKEHHFFRNIITLEHPRYIMQYKLKSLDQYLSRYLEVLHSLG